MQVVLRDGDRDSLLLLRTRSFFGLLVAASQTPGFDYDDQTTFRVSRFGQWWRVSNDRDVARLQDEDVCAVCRGEEGRGLAPLCHAPQLRSEVGEAVAEKEEAEKDEVSLLASLQKRGYARVTLSEHQRRSVDEALDAMDAFCNESAESKQRCALSSTHKKQPPFGYRRTDLQKQLFVCRPVPGPWPSAAFEQAVRNVYRALGDVALALANDLLRQLGWSDATIADLLHEAVPPSCPLDEEVPFRSMAEMFRYESPQSQYGGEVFVPCDSHQDVSLLTLIPTARGCPGLEMWDWQRGRFVAVERGAPATDCIVFVGDLWHKLVSADMQPAVHRVVVSVQQAEPRLSCPFELLPRPGFSCAQLEGDTSKQFVSKTSRKLKESVNY